MKELDSFTVDRLEEITELKALSFPPSHAEIAALARIALAAKMAEPVAYVTYKGYLIHAGDPKLSQYSDPYPLYDAPPLNSPEIPQGWIKCSDRMPENSNIQCFVYCKDSLRRTGYFDGNYWAINDKYYNESFVTHWQSFPAAPEKPL